MDTSPFPIIRIDDLSDPRLDAYARLTEVQLRNKLEPEKGIFIAESGKVIERALTAGMEPLSFLMEEKWVPQVQDILQRTGFGAGERACADGAAAEARDAERSLKEAPAPTSAPGFSENSATTPAASTSAATANPSDGLPPLFVAPLAELNKLTGFELTRGALGAFRRPALQSVEDLVRDAHLIAVLENITNHTNIGAIFRSAAALGVDAVLVTPASYDPLYRRAVRVSMGTVFQVPWTRIGADASGTPGHPSAAWADTGIPLLRSLGFKTAALALSDDSISLDDPVLKQADKLAVVLGTEGDGLAPQTIAHCDYTVRIPMKHGVDSLNVAAASAVAFWELRRW